MLTHNRQSGLLIAAFALSILPMTITSAAEIPEEQAQKLREQFLAGVRALDDSAKQKELLIREFIDISEALRESKKVLQELQAEIDKMGRPSSQNDLIKLKSLASQEHHLNYTIETARADQYLRMKAYRIIAQQEQLDKTFQEKQLSRGEYVRERQALDDSLFQIEQSRRWGSITIELTDGLARIKSELSTLRIR